MTRKETTSEENLNKIRKGLNANYIEANSEINRIAKTQLNEYFNQERKEFDIPLLTVGSDFQKSVWLELQQIPYGITETYLGLSIKMNNEKAIRAVSAANGANAISIFIPCHRVIGSKNELTGYAGGIPVKKKLLRLENVDLNHGQTNLFG